MVVLALSFAHRPFWQLESYCATNLQRISLDRVRVREFLEQLEAHGHLASWQNDICRSSDPVDPVVAWMLGIYARTAVIARLPLPVAGHPNLQERVHVLLQWNNLSEGIVDVESLARVNFGCILRGMEFIHLIGREGRSFILSQVKCFTGGWSIGPMTRGERAGVSAERAEGGGGERIGAVWRRGHSLRLRQAPSPFVDRGQRR